MVKQKAPEPTIQEESGLGPEWQSIDTPPIIPGSPAGAPPVPNDMGSLFSGSLPPQFQSNPAMPKYGTPGIASLPLMPIGASGTASFNSAVRSVIAANAPPVAADSGDWVWQGVWAATTTYNVNDVVSFNKSVYLALQSSVNSSPNGDSDPPQWQLIGENFLFNGVYTPLPVIGGYAPIDSVHAVDSAGVTTSIGPITPASAGEIAVWVIAKEHGVLAGTSAPAGWVPFSFPLIPGDEVGAFAKLLPTAAPITPTYTNVDTGSKASLVALFPYGGTILAAAVTGVQVGAANDLTITAVNSFSVGESVTFTGLATATFLNTSPVTILTASATKFTAAFTHSAYGPAADTGTVTGTGIVQKSAVENGGVVDPTIFTFVSPVKAKNTIIVIANASNSQLPAGNGGFATVSDTVNGAYTIVNSPQGRASPSIANLAYVQNVAAGSPTITVTWTGGIFDPIPGASAIQAFELIGGTSPGTQYLPYDVVEFIGSMYVCLKATKLPPSTDPTSWGLMAQGTGAVNNITGAYTALQSDYGKLLTNTTSSAFTVKLPNPPTENSWWAAFENTGVGTLIINPNGLNLDGSASNLTLTQNQGVFIFTDGVNYFTVRGTGGSGGSSVGGVNAQTISYLAVTGDSGKLVSMNGASLTLTLPAAPPSATWFISVENVNASSLIISRNGLNIDGAASNLTLTQNQGVYIFTDGANYFTTRGMGSTTTGTVTSVGLSLPAIFTVSGSPVTTSGTLTALLANETANTIFSGPTTGAAAAPTFRTMVSADILSSAALAGNPTTTTQSSTDNSTRIATTSYVTTVVSNAIAGVNPAVAVQAATVAILPNSPVYSNGVGGIGATITTLTLNSTLVVDGYTPALNDRVLVKNESLGGGLGAKDNGVYLVTQLAGVGLAWILTRALDYDQPSDINNTGAIPVINGTANTLTQWVLTSQVTTVGTDALTYAQFSINPSTIFINPMTTLGDIIYENVTPAATRLAGNITSVKQLLSQTGTGAVSAAPTWAALVAGDIPNLDASIITTGTLAIVRGGTGTGTPALVAGTNIAITGSWPNNTISANAGGAGVLASRTTAAVTTASLAPNATQIGTIAMSYSQIIIQIVATVVCRVQLYSTLAFQTADNTRPAGQQPVLGVPNGVICDLYLNTAGILTYQLSPVIVGSNQDGSRSVNLYYTITNISQTATTAVGVTITYVPLEA